MTRGREGTKRPLLYRKMGKMGEFIYAAWAKQNKDEHAHIEYHKKYRREHLEEKKEQNKRYRNAHINEIRAYHKEYYKNNPEKYSRRKDGNKPRDTRKT